MTSHPAGEIEDDSANASEMLAKKQDLLPGLVLITMRVELEILLAEPLPVLCHSGRTNERSDDKRSEIRIMKSLLISDLFSLISSFTYRTLYESG